MKISILLSLVLTVMFFPAFSQQKELFNNPDFSYGDNGWWHMGADVATSDGHLVFSISQLGENPWDIQLGQSSFPIRKGYRYTLSWKAKRANGSLNFIVQLNQSPYTLIFGKQENQNGEWQEGTVVYDHTSDDIIQAGFVVHMGLNTATAVFDYISLKEEPITNIPQPTYSKRGYYDAPYKRYEADLANLGGGAYTMPKSLNQADLQYEASDRVCVNMNAPGSSVEWVVTEPADGIVIRYSLDLKLPALGNNHTKVITGKLGVYVDNVKKATLDLTTYWSWEDLRNNSSEHAMHIQNANWRMRFDETRVKLDEKIPLNGKLKLVSESGDIVLDFAELELAEPIIKPPNGSAIYYGDGSDLQSFINNNGGKVIYLPPGKYQLADIIWFNKSDNTKLQGAGMWHTQLHFHGANGGLWSSRSNISFADFYMTTDRNSREQNYHAIRGAYDGGAIIERVWTEHFACGAWIAQYDNNGIPYADGLIIRHCRFRNSYADGVNLCEGSRNCIVEHCSFRNNGDDDMAIWPSQIECSNNTFRYNTSENCWRAHGAALYGGRDNKFHNLLIKDSYEAGISASNGFERVGFNENGLHEFYEITIISSGTKNTVFNNPVATITINAKNNAGDRIRNVRFSNIDIIDAKDDAILIEHQSGYGIENIIFENIHVNGTGKEFPYNNAHNITGERGYLLKVTGNMNGFASICNLTIENRGGSATKDILNVNTGDFVLSNLSDCPIKVNATGIKISKENLALFVYEKETLITELIPQTASNKNITWNSSNSSVATVTQTGVVKAISAGNAIVTATTDDGSFSAQCHVSVKSLPIYENKGDGNPISLITGQKTYLFDLKKLDFRVNEPHTAFDVDDVFTFAFDADENLKGDLPIAGYKGLLDWLDADPFNHFLAVHINTNNHGFDFFLKRIQNTNVFVADICLATLFGDKLPKSAFELGSSQTFHFNVFAKSNHNGINGDVHWKFVQPSAMLVSNPYTGMIVDNFETKTIGQTYPMKRCNLSDGTATIVQNPAYASEKAINVKTSNWDALLKLNVKLPDGLTLADYNRLLFDVYLLPNNSDVENNYKKINLYVDGIKVYEDVGNTILAFDRTWTTKVYDLNDIIAGNTFVLDLGISTPKGNYYIDNIRLKGKNYVVMPKSFKVEVKANPNSTGSVTGDGSYVENTSATINATPNPGYRFLNWTIGSQVVSTQPTYTFSVNNNVTLIANFEQETNQVVVSANPAYSGTVTGAGTYERNTNATVTATPNSGYRFLNWTIGSQVVSTQPTYTFTVTNNVTLIANFEKSTYQPESLSNNVRIKVYPNPTNGSIIIEGLPSLEKFNVGIYTVEGLMLDKFDLITGTSSVIDISNLRSGMFVMIIQSEKVIYTEKIILLKDSEM
jgi:hypothetical protein